MKSKPAPQSLNELHSLCRLTTIDRLKFWRADYGRDLIWIGYGLAHDDVAPNARWHCCARFGRN